MTGKRNYVWNGETFVDVTGWKRPPQKFPSIIRDDMRAAVHPATGQVLDSKSRFREVTRAHGLVEVGTDNRTNHTTTVPTDREYMQDAATAIEMLEQGYRPPPSEQADAATRLVGTE